MSDKPRFVRYGDKEMPVEEGMTLDQVKGIMGRHFPELAANPKIETKEEADRTIYIFTKQAGRKGAHIAAVAANLALVEPEKIMPPHIVALCARGVPTGDPGTLREVAAQLQKEGDRVSCIVTTLLDLPPAITPKGSVL